MKNTEKVVRDPNDRRASTGLIDYNKEGPKNKTYVLNVAACLNQAKKKRFGDSKETFERKLQQTFQKTSHSLEQLTRHGEMKETIHD